ncbi:MAG: MarR family transcriptional regulator [Pseudomonadota bacterium]
MLYPERAPGALQPLQWSILRFLEHRAPEEATVSAVARFIGISHAPVSRSIQTLCKKGLLSPIKCGTSRRSNAYALTPEGARMMQADPFLRLKAGFSHLDEKSRAEFERQLRHIVISLAKENE